MRQGRFDEALRVAEATSNSDAWWIKVKLGIVRVSHEELEAKAKNAMESTVWPRDGEPLYFASLTPAYCGVNDQALQLLRAAIDLDYCGYPAIDDDPAFNSLRNLPKFKQIRQAAIDCQQRFLRFRSQIPP